MSYIRAEEVLLKELIETIQQYVNGKAIYIHKRFVFFLFCLFLLKGVFRFLFCIFNNYLFWWGCV